MFGIRTDLALEAHEIYCGSLRDKKSIDGVSVENADFGGVKLTKIAVLNKNGEKALGRPIGTYVTLESKNIMYSMADYEKACDVLAAQIRSLGGVNDYSVILTVGLGNEKITPDSLGPEVVSKLVITRHMKRYIPQYVEEGMRSVCAIAPGVLGTTGIETLEIIKGTAERVKPDLIIAVDALAARSLDRISTTIQISDTGISPGAGVGNKRMGLNRETLGVKVIAVGVPTVVDAATVASDSIDIALKNTHLGSAALDNISTEHRHTLIKESLSADIGNLVVTPNNIDEIIEKISKTVANGINLALHKDLTLAQIASYVE